MSLYILNNFLGIAECHGNAGISAAVVDCDSACVLIAQCCAGECNVLNVAYALIVLSGVEQVLLAAVLNLPGLILVENASTEAVYKAVAGLENAVVEYQPALACLNRNRTCADLLGLPASVGSHNVSVLAPVCHVLGVRKVHIAEGCVTAVGRTGKHYILAVDLSGEQNAVSVEGEVCVFALVELLEVLCPANADGGLPAVSVAPCDPVSVLDPYTSGIVAVLPGVSLCCAGVVVDPLNLLGVDVPVDTVLGEACMDSHVSFLVVYTENACKLALERNNRRVEDGVACGKQIAGNNGVSVAAPDNVLAALGTILPRHIGNALSDDF